MMNEIPVAPDKRLGRLPTRSDTRALLFSRFAMPVIDVPPTSNFWPRRSPFPLRTFGNREYGDCTIASQAVGAQRMERLEVGRRASITDDEVIRVYVALSDRLYGGGDNGAYETDALDNWRRKDLTFRDTQKRPLTIDAYVRLNPHDHRELKTAIWTAGAKGIKICINLPAAFSRIDPPANWDIPAGQALVGEWMPGSWGGHSMWCRDYDEVGIWVPHTWGMHDQRITWPAVAAYVDEAHMVIDSLNEWRQRLERMPSLLNLDAIADAVNQVSPVKIR
jgi:hypothetical protein